MFALYLPQVSGHGVASEPKAVPGRPVPVARAPRRVADEVPFIPNEGEVSQRFAVKASR